MGKNVEDAHQGAQAEDSKRSTIQMHQVQLVTGVLMAAVGVVEHAALLHLEEPVDETVACHRRPTSQPEHQVHRSVLANIIVLQRLAILELLAAEDEALRGLFHTLLVCDLLLHTLNRLRGLHLHGDGLPRKRLYLELLTSPQT
eukprot:CAMPEP_0185158516 /NCGR_PEP_ID=MMETSP1139-20130426/2468_1 /TAXON_ID=298111 /ORGANISM="Pavlova sp., Strain CCMP459" /LENGTH=143 /DNA_ID=CAMNT_0027723659 /DNA_START=256 /DNA_END=687 /DNA_ORIENTATION=+